MKNHKRARTLLRVHGVLLILLGVSNAAASYVATLGPVTGPFQFLAADPFPEVGLLQAYLLAALTGVVLVIGSHQEKFHHFDMIGIGMHLIPPTALILMYGQVVYRMGSSVIAMSISIHAFFIAWESLALWFYWRGRKAALSAAVVRPTSAAQSPCG